MELESCRIDGGTPCRGGGCSCFHQVKYGTAVRIVGIDREFPSLNAVATFLKVSHTTAASWLDDGLKHGDIQLETVEKS